MPTSEGAMTFDEWWALPAKLSMDAKEIALAG